jgi:hypothetical protein
MLSMAWADKKKQHTIVGQALHLHINAYIGLHKVMIMERKITKDKMKKAEPL